uniref:EF-hand domain-containing protein n=1 Tax=Astatotilapia calliptera TaxID=8154 RepID=A0A3P8NI39_ASTCA
MKRFYSHQPTFVPGWASFPTSPEVGRSDRNSAFRSVTYSNKILSMVIFQLLLVRMDRSQQMSCSAASRNLASLAHTNRDLSCTMGFNEFKDLWQALNGWRGTFASFDRDQSGTIEGRELQQAINSMGYSLSPQAMNCIMKRYSLNGRIPFDEFVSCAVRLRALTDQFRRRDTTQTGNASFQYDDFIQVTMSI